VSFLIEDLIESVKSRSFVPISQTTFQDADIITILNEELRLKLVADLLSAREDFFLWRKTTPLVANKQLYTMPNAAIGNAIKALFFVDSNGNQRPLTRKDIDELGDWSNQTGDAQHFYFEGDQVGLFPYPSDATSSLLFVYPRKPNELTDTASCAKITAVSSLAGTTTFTVDTDLTASLSVGDTVDFLRGSSPYLLWADAVSITAITTTTIAVATTSVDDVDGSVEPASGDYICPAGYANIPMIPEEFQMVLAQMGAVRLLASLGAIEKWQTAKAELQELRKEALKLVKNRAESAPDKITRKNPLLSAFRSW
jgi:hypothetical protein